MSPIIIHYREIMGQTGHFNLGIVTSLGERKLRLETCVKKRRKIGLVTHPAGSRVVGVKYVYGIKYS